MSLKASAQPETRLTGRWLIVARSLWIGMVALALGVYLFSIPVQFAYFQIICSGAACPGDQISPAGLAQLQQAGLSLGFFAGYFTALNAFFVLVFWIVAAVIFWRKSEDWLGIFVSLTLVLFAGTVISGVLSSVGQQHPALLFLSALLSSLASTCFFIFFYIFPDGHFAPRWIAWLVPFVAVHEVLAAFQPDLFRFPYDWFLTAEVASAIFAQVYRYGRVSNPVQRQQTKWVVFGSAIGGIGLLSLILYAAVAFPGGNPPTAVSGLLFNTGTSVFIGVIPLSIGMAILRSRLWDIDILIRRTLTYGVITALLALVYLGDVVALQTIFTALTGAARSELVTVVSTLVIAALFIPLRNRVQTWIDRRFYRRRYDTQLVLAKFAATTRDEVDLHSVTGQLLDVIDETLQPVHVTLWLKSGGQPNGETATKPGRLSEQL